MKYRILHSVFSLLFLLFFLQLEGQFDVQNGPVQILYPNGQVASEGKLVNGQPDGYWKTYYVTGIVKSEGTRINGLLDSTWNFYNQAGDLVEVINYKGGKKSGYSIKYTYDNPNNPGKPTILSKELYINDKKEGKSEYYFNTGELKEEVNFVGGKKESYSREYDRKGTIITLKQFKDNYLVSRERINRTDNLGRKQGTYKEFFEDGTLKKEVNFMDDELHGYFREFDQDGKLMQTLRYEHGTITEEIDEEAKEIIDFRRTFDKHGHILFSGGYRNGVPIGIHRMYDSTGTVINSIIYNEEGKKTSEGIVDDQGNRKGDWIDLYPDGSVRAKGSYRGNRRQGEWIFYFPTGKIEQKGNFLNGRFNGRWVWYYDSGQLWRDENYFNGKEDGYCVEYDEAGNVIEEGNYINGEKDGKWTYLVGDHREEGNFLIGLREGKWTHYYLDGSKQFEGNYVRGLPDGRLLYFNPDGTIKEEQYYKDGIRDRTWFKYDESGEIELSVSYRNNKEVRINGMKVNLPDNDVKVIN